MNSYFFLGVPMIRNRPSEKMRQATGARTRSLKLAQGEKNGRSLLWSRQKWHVKRSVTILETILKQVPGK